MFWSYLLNIILTVFMLSGATNPWLDNAWDKTDMSIFDLPEFISAEKAAVLSSDGRELIFNKEADEPQAIASITKLMTALVFLDRDLPWDQVYQVVPEDAVSGGRLNLFTGDSLSLDDLFKTALIASDNGATKALVRSTGLSEEEFVNLMNEKARDLRLLKTSFLEPTGLSEYNVSTAREVALLAYHALRHDKISEALRTPEYEFLTKEGKNKIISSTDHLLFDTRPGNLKPLGGKTGYTDLAGYCFVGRFQGDQGEDLIVSILNSGDKNQRFRDSKNLADFIAENYYIKQIHEISGSFKTIK